LTLRRSQGVGETITLRALIKDDQDDPATTASGLSVSIFGPDGDYTDPTDALETGTPTLFAGGIYEYEYSIPSDSETGIFQDYWTAELNGQALTALFSFEVLDAGSIESLGGQLNYNNIVDVTVSSGILASDGAALAEDYSWTFLTEVSPCYSDSIKLELEAGSALSGLTDDALYLAILEASIEADQFSFNTTDRNGDFFLHARREWATCKAAAILAVNIKGGFYTQSKRLGDLSVTYNQNALNELLDRIASCLARWEPQLMAGGYGTQNPIGVIKGEYDPDRPQVGRVWFSDDEGSHVSRKVPAANTKDRTYYKRRWQRGYKSRWK